MVMENPQMIVKSKLGKRAALLFHGLSEQILEKSDAIIFFQGDQLDRAPAVQLLYEQGFSKKILITGNNVLVGPGKRSDENDFPLPALVDYLVSHRIPREAIMVEDQSMNSKEQAMNILRVAKEQKWSSILVVVSLYHMLRAYLVLVRQMNMQGWHGKIVMYGVKLAWDKPPSGRTKTALEMFAIEMEKIQKYTHELASIKDGLRTFQLFSKKQL